ncbi:hypothetical protein CPC08DRAFT_760785 [Agrocybe pediades]|nr:hypothetical protein CPC08DRAFT_760785 [Agrocybe pediades]
MSQTVMVDDTDSKIRYSSGWNAEDGSKWASQGNFGAPFMNTLHTTNAATASFTFDFEGSSGEVVMTNNVKLSGSSQDPVWECKIDGNTIPLGKPFQFTENNWTLCSWSADQVSPGKHTLTVTSTSSGQTLLLDYIQYTPSPGVSVSNSFIRIDDTDSAIQYGSGWQSINGLGRIAANGGSTMTLSFYGTGMIWMATQPTELPHVDSTAEYSIDDGPVTSFIIKQPGSTTQYFQSYFQTTGLSLGTHKLTVTSRGQTSQTPLVLTSIVVQGGSTNPPTTSPGGSSNGGTTVGGGNGGNGGDSGGNSGGNSGNNNSGSSSGGSSASQTITTKVPLTITTVDSKGSQTVVVTAPVTTVIVSGGGGDSSNNSGGKVDGGNLGDTNSGQNAADSNKSAANAATQESKDGAPVGAIVGGILGAIVVIGLIIALVLCRRRRQRKQLGSMAQAFPPQPFYQDTVPGHPTPATYATSASTQPSSMGMYQSSHSHPVHRPAMIPPSKASAGMTSPSSSSAPQGYTRTPGGVTDSSLYSNPRSTLLQEGSVAGYSTSTPSEVSAPSVASSGTPMLHAPMGSVSKHQEAFGTMPEAGPSHSVAITHQDSGIRLPQPQPTIVEEFPPMYTAS